MMADCNVYEPLLHCVVDGEAGAEERRRVMEHLAECPVCREKFQQLTELHMAFEELDAEVPAGLRSRVMETVRAERAKERRGRTRRWRSGILAAAACCAIAFLGVQGLGGMGGSSAPMEAAGQRAVMEEGTALVTADDAAVELYSYAVTDVANSVIAQSGTVEAPAGKSEEAMPDEKAEARSEETLSAVMTKEPAVLEWLEENRPGETADVKLTEEEVRALAAWLAEQGIDLPLPESGGAILTCVE